MAWGVEDLDSERAQSEGIPLGVVFQVRYLPGQGKELASSPVGIRLVDIDLRLGQGPDQVGNSGSVVVVAVCQKDILHLYPVLF